MPSIDIAKPVKLIKPEPGEENIVFKITNFNEVTNRCYIKPINLESFKEGFEPEELVSIDELTNIDERI